MEAGFVFTTIVCVGGFPLATFLSVLLRLSGPRLTGFSGEACWNLSASESECWQGPPVSDTPFGGVAELGGADGMAGIGIPAGTVDWLRRENDSDGR